MKPVYATYDWKANRGFDQVKYCSLCGARIDIKVVAHKPRPACRDCGFTYYKNPYPAVSVLVVSENKILLGKRTGEPGKSKWAVPSGYIEFEDDFVTAAVREVKEETGLAVEIQAVLAVQSAFLPPDYHFLGIYLLARVTGGKLCAGDDLESVAWFSFSGSFPEMAFPPDLEIIQAYSRGSIAQLAIER